jgi:hypothetical protein
VLLLITNSSVEGSGIFIDFANVGWRGIGAKKRLLGTSESFLNESVIPNEHRGVEDIVSMTFGNDEAHSIRTFATFEGAHVWVIQLVFWVERQLIFILHWNGPDRLVKNVIGPIFDSFRIDS